MSQDLFAAFGGEDTGQIWRNEGVNEQASPVSSDRFQPIWAIEEPGWDEEGVTQTNPRSDDDDDFGDFEDASSAKTAESRTNEGTFAVESITSNTTTPRQDGNKSFPPKASYKQTLEASASQSQKKQENVGHHPFAGHMDLLFESGEEDYDAGADELGDLSSNPEAAMAYSKRIIAQQEFAQSRLSETVLSKQKTSNQASAGETKVRLEPNRPKKESGHIAAKDPNVLFDADDLSEEEADAEDDDDFDDFETGYDSITKISSDYQNHDISGQTAMPTPDLLSLDDSPQTVTNTRVNGELSRNQEMRPVGKKQPSARAISSISQLVEENDPWDDFETAVLTNDSSGPEPLHSSPLISGSRPFPSKPISKEQDRLPPTNVPPPVIILSVFPSLFADADDALFNAIGKLDLKQKQMLLAHPASYQFLKGYLSHCTVLARIIIGRKLRWKRDQRLSQSMRIGPAAAGGKGGMKLAGLDKTEVAKEDREVLDVLRLWRNQVGKLRTAVTAASSAPAVPKLPPVPEIGEQMPVKSLKPAEGGITAPHPCALCGLKREERVGKVDVEVEDNFGEWWVQDMNMHLACRNFWDEFERKFKSR